MRRPHGSGDSHATDRAFIARELAEDNYDFAHRYDDAPGTPPVSAIYHRCSECGAWCTDQCCLTAAQPAPAGPAGPEKEETKCPF
jgi:hypothetical protein